MGEQDAILVVDADPEAALLLRDFLEREGYSVAAAATGGEGLRLIRQERFALVFLDLQLPDVDSREARRRICRELARLLGADTAAAYLHEFRTGQLVPTAAYHVPKEYLATLSSAPLPLKDQGFFLPLWAERRPVYSDDIAQDERFTHGMFRSFPHQSGLLLPLIVDDEVIGGFYLVWWTVRRRFSAHDLRALEHICEQVGFFLRNAHLYEQAERNRHRLEVLNDVSRRLAAVHDADEVLTIIVNEAARLVGAEAAGLRLLEGDDLVVSARTESAATVMSRPP